MKRGSAVACRVDMSAYCMPCDSSTVYKYECTENKWTELTACPNCNSTLVMLNEKFIAIGGESDCGVSGILYN